MSSPPGGQTVREGRGAAERWAGPIERVLPALLTVGVLVPNLDAWRQVFEIALLPMFGWYAWRYGLGGRQARMLVVPLAWIAWLGLSGAWGSADTRAQWDDASMDALQTGLLFLVLMIFLRITPGARLERIAVALVLAAGLSLFRDVAEHIGDHGISLTPRFVGRGLFSNANEAAAISCLMLLFALYLFTSTPNALIRAVALLYMPLSVVHIVLTGSRGGFLVLMVTLLTYFVVSGGKAQMWRFVVVVGLVLGLVLGAIALFPSVGGSIWENLSRNSYRLGIWQESWRLGVERPFIGHGFKFPERILGFSHPHNLHLSNLLYGGVVAVALGLVTLGAAALRALSIYDRSCRALAAAAFVLAFSWSLTEGGVPLDKPDADLYHFWIPVTLALGLPVRGRDGPSDAPGSLERGNPGG